MKKVLLVEDDTDFAIILKQYLALYNFEVTWVQNGEEALEIVKTTSFSICIFDVMMPKMDGFSLAHAINNLNLNLPYIFLSAKKLKEDKVRGLLLGADDYIVKPFEAEELILRLNNILKRTEKSTTKTTETNIIQLGKYTFNPTRFELSFENTIKILTEKESQVLVYFFENKNKVIKREEILNAIWENSDYFSGRSMDVYISKLRKHLIHEKKITIKSIRNIGLEFILK